MQLNDKQTRIVATVAAVGMYVSYISQIQNNFNGHPGSWLQPLVAACNCTLWVVYGLFKKVRDWPVALANAPGIFLYRHACRRIRMQHKQTIGRAAFRPDRQRLKR